MTADEFQQQCLQPLIPKWRRLIKQHPAIYQDGVYVSWDRAKWHKPGRVLADARDIKFKQMPVPPQSHDIHKVIEHAINTFKAAFRKHLIDHPEIQRLEEIKAAAEKTFFKAVTRDGVRKDIRSLPATFRAINRSVKSGGTEGGWALKGLRYELCSFPQINDLLQSS